MQLLGPAAFPAVSSGDHCFSVLSYNVLLPNSADGWWTYKMYSPPLSKDTRYMGEWEYRRSLIQNRIETVDSDIVCFQEVAPVSFEDDFAFMKDLGYEGEMFKRGRFRPATFWKRSMELAAPPVHKDRTLLTAFKMIHQEEKEDDILFVLNCHLQAGKQAPRRLRQIHEGCRAVLTLARKLKIPDPETTCKLIVCGDFNGSHECAAVRYLEDGAVDETFREDGEPVSSNRKALPFSQPLTDVSTTAERPPPPTMVVSELLTSMVEGEAYENPKLSQLTIERLRRIFHQFASSDEMSKGEVEAFMKAINGEIGRGSEFREAAWQMGSKEERPTELPEDATLSLQSFLEIYQKELSAGKFWGIAHDLAILKQPMPDCGTFASRYDRMYSSKSIRALVVMDFECSEPCPNANEPSDHLPVAGQFCF